MTKPLAGRRVLVTRARERAAGLVDALHELGAQVLVVPLLATEPIIAPAGFLFAECDETFPENGRRRGVGRARYRES